VTVDDYLSLRRVGAIVRRHVYVMAGSWPRLVELAYWPLMQMLVWGFTTQFFLTHSSWLVQASGALIAGVLLWDVLFRGQLGLSISFLEEMWSRNLANLFVSPLRVHELALALITMSLIRALIGLLPAALLAIPLYHYSIFSMGLPLLAFFFNLIVTGWAVALAVCGLILRYGQGAESLAWGVAFFLAPFSGVYYPIATLPLWCQGFAWLLPSSYIFEGMRAALIDGTFRVDLVLWASGLNVIWLGLGFLGFLQGFRLARRRGAILQQGE
jgi:ABC-2 type transport system permease protein